MNTDHSPLPWHLCPEHPTSGGLPVGINMGLHVAGLYTYGASPETNLANAHLITRAVNSHYQLVEALEQLLYQHHCESTGRSEDVWRAIPAISDAFAALELAKKGLEK